MRTGDHTKEAFTLDGDLVHGGGTIFRVTNRFRSEPRVVDGPFTELLVRALVNP